MHFERLWRPGLLMGVVACVSCSSSDVSSADPGLVAGRIERVTGEGHTNDEPVVFGTDSEAVISLYSNPAPAGDGDSTLLAEQRISPAPSPPFDFTIRGPLALIADRTVSYLVNAKLSQQRGVDTVGDMVSEQLVLTQPPSHDVLIGVSGLESCQAANAGGFCL